MSQGKNVVVTKRPRGGGVEWGVVWNGGRANSLQSRIRMDMSLGFALEGTIRNISFLPKVDCVI